MNVHIKAPTLIVDRITLRSINPDTDNQPFYKMFLEPDMHLWTGNDIPNNEVETYELLCKYRDLEDLISWSIIKNDTQDFIGTYWVAPYENVKVGEWLLLKLNELENNIGERDLLRKRES